MSESSSSSESLLEMAERHVREGTMRVERQRQILVEMERDNHPHAAETAQKILATLENSLRLSHAQLDELRASQGIRRASS
jgi:capsule polysaccharide export protein KpsE/RkpR